jgi:curved DNA-binding protein CbpA
MADNPYRTLRVRRNASPAEIRQAFLKLAKKYHPDLNAGNKRAEEKFKKLNEAHARLTAKADPELVGQVAIGPDGNAQVEDIKEISRKPGSALMGFLADLGYDLLSVVLAVLKAIDMVLTGIWTVIKVIFALR